MSPLQSECAAPVPTALSSCLASRSCRGPVWVYVLERRRAVAVWNSLMGDPDPEVARRETPNSLRALYGISAAQNGVMGSPDAQTAEVQIQAMFASSPPFPTAELPDVGQSYNNGLTAGSLRSVSSSVLEQLRSAGGGSEYASSHAGESANGAGKSGFRARALPPTHAAPDIVPRMSKAAALRAGIAIQTPKRVAPTKERLAETFANVPGHKRSETITVASTAPPVVAPRMTRAASLRLGIKPAEKKKPAITNAEQQRATFDGVPGHKRRESIAVASTKPPTVAPRLNKSAALRQQKEAAPPTSFQCTSCSGCFGMRSECDTHHPRCSRRTSPPAIQPVCALPLLLSTIFQRCPLSTPQSRPPSVRGVNGDQRCHTPRAVPYHFTRRHASRTPSVHSCIRKAVRVCP